MSVLPNSREPFGRMISNYDGSPLGLAEIVAIHSLPGSPPHDDHGVPWQSYVSRVYSVARQAEGQFDFPIDIPSMGPLKGPDPHYSLIAVIAPSGEHAHGIKMVGYLGIEQITLDEGSFLIWNPGPVFDPRNRTLLLEESPHSFYDALIFSAQRILSPIAGEDPLIVSDGRCSLTPYSLSKYGFSPLLTDLKVPSLRNPFDQIDDRYEQVTLYVKPGEKYSHEAAPSSLVEAFVLKYLDLVQGVNAQTIIYPYFAQAARLARQQVRKLASPKRRGRAAI